MEDTNVKLTLDLGSRVLQQVTKLSNAHSFSVMWDLGPNVVLACKYLAAALIACKSLESVTSIIVSLISSRSDKKHPKKAS